MSLVISCLMELTFLFNIGLCRGQCSSSESIRSCDITPKTGFLTVPPTDSFTFERDGKMDLGDTIGLISIGCEMCLENNSTSDSCFADM